MSSKEKVKFLITTLHSSAFTACDLQNMNRHSSVRAEQFRH
uniref:Uncharacterized protein n=1 Tax=Arundo donax TaxID=35708 RepID=A0A0A9GXZ7_ARUDO